MLARFTTMNVLRGWDVRLEASMTTLSVHEDEDSIVRLLFVCPHSV